MLGSVSNAEDIQWTGLGADNLWSTPENWDLGRVPTLADDVRIDVPAAAAPNGPVIQDGIDAKANGIFTEAPGEPTLTMTGGSLEVADWIWWGDGADSFGIWTMSGGTVDVANEFELGWGGGAGTLIMTSGTVNARKAKIPTSTGAFGELFLHGGTYHVTGAGELDVKDNGLIDITEGTLVLEGDDTAKINNLIAAGLITAYGGDGVFELDYDARNPGKTTLTAVERAIFLFDDFEGYADDAGLTAAGWTILDTPTATEDSTWTITNPGGRANPPTLDGSPSVGNFMISDSDTQSVSGDQDNGASHDLYTPSFSTLGASTVWLHVDVSAQLNNNGTAIFDVEVSTDGEIWTNVFSCVSPGRGTSEPATTRLPDNTNADGYFGRLDLDISAVAANKAAVQVRFRHYEPDWDWWIAIDNVLVDNVAAPQGGPTTVFSEDFSNGLGQMNVFSGQGNTGTETWHTTDKGGRYVPGTVQERGVNRLGPHPNEHPEFAIIDSDADPDPAEDEWLMTPTLDLSGMTEVFLHYESETVMSDGVSNQEVLISLDGGSTFETTPIFAYTGGGLFDNGEEPAFAERIFDVSAIAAGESQVVFAFRYTGDGDDWWWAIDNVKVTGLPEPVDPGTDGLVAYYPLDNDVLDASGNGNDGTIVGNPTWIAGVEGTALEFHGLGAAGGGGDYIDCGNDASLDITGPISIALWIRPGADDPEGQGTETAPMAKAMSGMSPDWSWQVRYGWGSPQPYMAFTFNTSPRAWAYVGRNLERDEWCHIACSHDGTTLKCYLNGEQTDATPMGAITSSETPLLIGSDGWGCDWIGAIDEVAIYNRDLSDGEIRYLAGYREVDPSLVIYYSFDEVSDIVADQSGKGHDGAVVGDVTVEANGKYNGAAKFASGSYLDLDGPSFPAEDIPTSAMTLAAWAKCENTGDHHAIFNARASDATWVTHPELRSEGNFRWLLRSYGGTTIFDIRAGVVTWDEWLHFAGTYSQADGVGILYINGQEVGRENARVNEPIAGDWGQGARVGYNIDNARPFTGLMDEFCMFKRALSQDEILEIMQGM